MAMDSPISPHEIPDCVRKWLVGHYMWQVSLYTAMTHWVRAEGNVSEAARTMGVTRDTMYRWLRQIEEVWGGNVVGVRYRRKKMLIRSWVGAGERREDG